MILGYLAEPGYVVRQSVESSADFLILASACESDLKKRYSLVSCKSLQCIKELRYALGPAHFACVAYHDRDLILTGILLQIIPAGSAVLIE